MLVMAEGTTDPRWPKLLSLAVHEFRTPITVVAGYIRMLLKDRAGPITEQQRKLLEEAEKSCGRLSALVAEMSDLSNLEGGTASLNRSTVDLRALVQEAVTTLPPMPDRDIAVELQPGIDAATVPGDATRLRGAVTSLIIALRRELVTTDRLLVRVSSAQVTDLYRPDELVGRQVVAVVNFPPKNVAGVESQCLVLGLHTEAGVVLLCADRPVPDGSRVT